VFAGMANRIVAEAERTQRPGVPPAEVRTGAP
jgi:hypothetical protein